MASRTVYTRNGLTFHVSISDMGTYCIIISDYYTGDVEIKYFSDWYEALMYIKEL